MAWSCLISLLLPALLAPVAVCQLAFTPNMTVVNIPEDTEVGKTVFWMTVTNPNLGSLIFSISGTHSSFFKVNSNTGEVTLQASLDYETLQYFIIMLQVQDSISQGTPARQQMSVIVEDRNDNAPVFMNKDFSVSIKETEPPGFQIYKADARDPDSGAAGSIVYSIDAYIPNNIETQNLFAIEKNGAVILKDKLSYNNKSASYQLTLKACDLGGLYQGQEIKLCSGPVFLSITVIDMPDLDPMFLKDPYLASVAEGAQMGTSVLKVEAVDGDRGLNYEMEYSITNSTRPGWFHINPASGVITVLVVPDREELLNDNEEVKMEVTATEKEKDISENLAKASVNVIVTVTDINDNIPQFFNCTLGNCDFAAKDLQTEFSGSVDEHASTGIPIDGLTMMVHDPDKGENATFTLSLEGADAAAFSVSPLRAVSSTEVQVLVKNPSLVDFEKQPSMGVKVKATDTKSGKTSEAQVTVVIRDINDNRPVFSEKLYECHIQEHCTDNVACQNIIAHDQDQGQWGKITYSLLPGGGSDMFVVNPESGQVTAKDCALLDREKQAVYYLTLQATDGGGQSATTSLQIFLTDINDKAPRVLGTYNVFVQEGKHIVECIQAIDEDEPGTDNSRLKFELEVSEYSQSFSVNASGCIYNTVPLDREAIDPNLDGRIMLKVKISDHGIPVLSTVADVNITVEDINDNEPVFSPASYDFSVKEAVSSVEVGKVTATDKDQTTTNNRISFRLEGSGSNNFILKPSEQTGGKATGVLLLPSDVKLDYETLKLYSFSVIAENLDPGSPVATASVRVSVLDVNDVAPALVEASLRSVSVTENGTQHGEVTQVEAVDPDTTAQMEFQEVNVLCAKDGVDVGSLCSHWFSVLPNGSVVISQSGAIDYEACDQVTLIVRAHDKGTDEGFPAYSSNGSLVINIMDVNDNVPYFLPDDKTFVVIPELLIPNQEVASVQAKDDDSEKNGNIDFSIVKAEFVPKTGAVSPFQGFQIFTNSKARVFTGSIQTMTSLDPKLQGTYEVTVQAQDKPSIGSVLQAQTVLKLFTVDQSYRITLEFSSSKEEVGANVDQIKEALGQATRTSVYIVSIQDKENVARAQGRSYLDAYFVYSNGTALTLDQLSVMIRGDQNSLTQLLQLGLVVLGAEDKQDADLTQRLSSVIIGLGVALALLIIIMTTALVCVRRSHKRELRAVKAAKEARQTVMGTAPTSSTIPGTNIYNSERANPVLNLTAKDLGFESQSSGSDVDCTSLNSLDENSVDLGKDKEKSDKKKPPQRSKKEADKVSLHSQTEADDGLLSMVLSSREEDASGQHKVSFSNPGFDPTEEDSNI